MNVQMYTRPVNLWQLRGPRKRYSTRNSDCVPYGLMSALHGQITEDTHHQQGTSVRLDEMMHSHSK